MAASPAAHGVAETKEVVNVSFLKMRRPEVGRSTLAAVNNHRTLDLRNRCDWGNPQRNGKH